MFGLNIKSATSLLTMKHYAGTSPIICDLLKPQVHSAEEQTNKSKGLAFIVELMQLLRKSI